MFLRLCNNIFVHNQKCANFNKSTSPIFRKQFLEPDTDVFCQSSIETLYIIQPWWNNLGLFIHSFNYLSMDPHGVIFHSDPQLVTYSAAKYLNEILGLTKSCSQGKKDLSVVCESTSGTYKLNQPWYSNAHLNIKLILQYINSNSSCFSRKTFQKLIFSSSSISSQVMEQNQLPRALSQSIKIFPKFGSCGTGL